MKTYTTDAGFKILIDFMDWSYTWEEVIDNFGIRSDFGVYMNKRGYQKLDTTPYSQEQIDVIMQQYDGDSEEEWKESFKKFLDENYLEYFYYDSSYNLFKICKVEDADGFVCLPKKILNSIYTTKEEFLEAINILRHYITGEFYYIQIFEPELYEITKESGRNHPNAPRIKHWEYIDGGIFFLDEDSAIDSLPKDFGNVDKITESDIMEYYERIY